MKIISDLGRGVVGTWAIVAVLSGCSSGSGAAQLPIPTAPTQFGNPGAAFSAGSPDGNAAAQVASNPAANAEILSGKAKVKCKGGTTFRVRGTAAGPYRGTFIATGSWGSYFEMQQCGPHENCIIGSPFPVWSFEEDFTITSGSTEISGRITGSGIGDGPFSRTVVSNVKLPYSSSIAKGNANIESIAHGDFQETLVGL